MTSSYGMQMWSDTVALSYAAAALGVLATGNTIGECQYMKFWVAAVMHHLLMAQTVCGWSQSVGVHIKEASIEDRARGTDRQHVCCRRSGHLSALPQAAGASSEQTALPGSGSTGQPLTSWLELHRTHGSGAMRDHICLSCVRSFCLQYAQKQLQAPPLKQSTPPASLKPVCKLCRPAISAWLSLRHLFTLQPCNGPHTPAPTLQTLAPTPEPLSH